VVGQEGFDNGSMEKGEEEEKEREFRQHVSDKGFKDT
jgi:hypothetical protein